LKRLEAKVDSLASRAEFDELKERVAALEQRLAALETRASGGTRI
jgi:polyhydroxyalkanoate synthesis regulator phasin